MLEAKLTIEIPGLSAALENLAAAIACRGQSVSAASEVLDQRRQAYNVGLPDTAAPAAPVPLAPAANLAPVTAPAAVPLAPTAPAPSFTLEQVSKAGADLIAANSAKMPELLALLAQFGVPAVTELKPEQLGPFATALRGLGGKL